MQIALQVLYGSLLFDAYILLSDLSLVSLSRII